VKLDRARLRALLPLWTTALVVGWLLWSLGNAKPFLGDALRLLEIIGALAVLWGSWRVIRTRGGGDRRHEDRRRKSRRGRRG
jgi:hypothetical protein